MVRELKGFQCEICFRVYDTRKEARECEIKDKSKPPIYIRKKWKGEDKPPIVRYNQQPPVNHFSDEQLRKL